MTPGGSGTWRSRIAVAILGAATLSARAAASAQVAATPVVPTETVERVQLDDGTFTLTARGDGRVTVAVLRLAPLDVAAADFSMPTLRAFVASIRSQSASGMGAGVTDAASAAGTAGSASMLASIDDRMSIGIDRRSPPMLIALRGRERVPVVLRLTPAVTADTMAAIVDRAIARARELTAEHAPALVDASDAAILRLARTNERPAAPTSSSTAATKGWSKADRGYLILVGALVGGAAASVMASKGGACWDREPCSWEQGAPGPIIAGSLTLSTMTGIVSQPGSTCSLPRRSTRAAVGAVAGTIPGAVLVLRGERAGLMLVPVGQLWGVLMLTNECANPAAGS